MADGQDGGKSMRIAVLVEGITEKAFKPFLIRFLEGRLQGNMPKLDFHPYHGRIPTGDKLRRVVGNYLNGGKADHVIALTDLYTGSMPPVFGSTEDAVQKMRCWVGRGEARFHPHVAKHDFEAWLLPYWPTIQKLAQHNKTAPSGEPENVNHNKPPSYHIKELFEIGKTSNSYIKARDAGRILRENDLSVAIDKCPELKSFINTILKLSGGQALP